jgi:hypothetical protein
MGMLVSIFRSDYDSTMNAFHGRKRIVVVNIPGPFEPDKDTPAARLIKSAYSASPILVPDGMERHQVMFGGTYAATSDSRFLEAVHAYGAIPIHDRIE